MSRWVLVLPALFLMTAPGPAQESPYTGLETREIKALSSDQVASLLGGEGMGFALAAELNRYPGPKHVLQMRDHLNLTENQITSTTAAFDRMQASAQDLGKRIVEREQRLDLLFKEGRMTEGPLRKLIGEIAALNGEVRIAHLLAHLEMKGILNEEQIRQYVGMRGYHGAQGHRHDR